MEVLPNKTSLDVLPRLSLKVVLRRRLDVLPRKGWRYYPERAGGITQNKVAGSFRVNREVFPRRDQVERPRI